MLTKCDTDVEQFKAILLKHQPEIKHLLEENINEKLIQSKITAISYKYVTNSLEI